MERPEDLGWLISTQAELDALEKAGYSQRLVFTLFAAAGVLISLGGRRASLVMTWTGFISALAATALLIRDVRRSRRRRALEREIEDFDDRMLPAGPEEPPGIPSRG